MSVPPSEWTTSVFGHASGPFRVLVLYNPLESRTGAMDCFYCPAFTTESSHQISCLPFVFHKAHRVFVVLVSFSRSGVPNPSHFPCTSQIPIITSFHPTCFLINIGTYGPYTETFSRKQIIHRIASMARAKASGRSRTNWSSIHDRGTSPRCADARYPLTVG